ncbi:MAG: S8 family serine peptidase [Candidatus Thermoplasmatota archaeon]
MAPRNFRAFALLGILLMLMPGAVSLGALPVTPSGASPAMAAPTTQAAAPAADVTLELSEQDMVGYTGTFPVPFFVALGMRVDAVYPDAGFALVSTRDPSLLQTLGDALPGISFVARNGETRADTARWDTAQWDAAHWDAAQWDSAQWDAATWDSAQWDSAQWDSAQWDSSQWDAAHWDGTRYRDATMDPGFGNDWLLGAMHAPQAWTVTTGYHALTICIVDSGIDATHPDLALNVKRLADGSFGYDFITGTKDGMDDGGHGTVIAGIAAGVLGNGHGITGVSQAYVVSAKVINATGYGTEADLALGIRWCVDTGGAKIITLALHTEQDNPGVHDAVKYAKSKGALLLAASGNDGNVCDKCVRFPAAYKEALGVGASAPDGSRAPFSNGGDELSFLAPGVQIPGPWPGGGYVVGSGTSQATGAAAGAAALVWAAKPSLSADQVRDALQRNAKDAGDSGFDEEYGHGLLRLDRTLRALDLLGGHGEK